MKLVLPYPPSVNGMYATVRGHRVLSADGRNYKRRAAMIALASGVRPIPADVPVVVSVGIFRPRKSGDLDNTLKVLLDSLTGIAYVDDGQIVEILARRYEDKANPRAEVTIEVERRH